MSDDKFIRRRQAMEYTRVMQPDTNLSTCRLSSRILQNTYTTCRIIRELERVDWKCRKNGRSKRPTENRK